MCVFALAACGGDSGKTAESPKPVRDEGAGGPNGPADHDHGADGAHGPNDPHGKLDELYGALAASIKGVDCPTYSAKLLAWVRDNESKVRQLEQQIEDPASIDEHLADAFEIILDGAAECVDSDEAQAAFDTFDELFFGG